MEKTKIGMEKTKIEGGGEKERKRRAKEKGREKKNMPQKNLSNFK